MYLESFDFSPYVRSEVDTIISGGAVGIDTLAEEYADIHKLSKYIMRPRYDLYGRAAPLKRNEQMVDAADAILIVWDGASKGTRHTVNYAQKKNKPLTIVQI